MAVKTRNALHFVNGVERVNKVMLNEVSGESHGGYATTFYKLFLKIRLL